MYKITGLTEEELNEVGAVFYDYEYADDEDNLFYMMCGSLKKALIYFKACTLMGLKWGLLYAPSEKKEGYIFFKDPTIKPTFGCVMAFFGLFKGFDLKSLPTYLKQRKAAGLSLESKLEREKKKFINVEMVVVRRPYQGQGQMRKLLKIAFDRADELGVSCLVTTDAKLKMEKYRHLGFELVQERKYTDQITMYDMIRQPHDKK